MQRFSTNLNHNAVIADSYNRNIFTVTHNYIFRQLFATFPVLQLSLLSFLSPPKGHILPAVCPSVCLSFCLSVYPSVGSYVCLLTASLNNYILYTNRNFIKFIIYVSLDKNVRMKFLEVIRILSADSDSGIRT